MMVLKADDRCHATVHNAPWSANFGLNLLHVGIHTKEVGVQADKLSLIEGKILNDVYRLIFIYWWS